MEGIYPIIDTNTCDKCGKCAENCPTKILVKEEYGMAFHPRPDEECLYCGECEASCPHSAIKCVYTIRVK